MGKGGFPIIQTAAGGFFSLLWVFPSHTFVGISFPLKQFAFLGLLLRIAIRKQLSRRLLILRRWKRLKLKSTQEDGKIQSLEI